MLTCYSSPSPHPYCGGGHTLPKPYPLGACGASPHICQPSYFFRILTLPVGLLARRPSTTNNNCV